MSEKETDNQKAREILENIKDVERHDYEDFLAAKDVSALRAKFIETLGLEARGPNGSFYYETLTIKNPKDDTDGDTENAENAEDIEEDKLSLRGSDHQCNGNKYKEEGFLRLSIYITDKNYRFVYDGEDEDLRADDYRLSELRYTPEDFFARTNKKSDVKAAVKRRKANLKKIFGVIVKAIQTGKVDFEGIEPCHIMRRQKTRSLEKNKIDAEFDIVDGAWDYATDFVKLSRLADELLHRNNRYRPNYILRHKQPKTISDMSIQKKLRSGRNMGMRRNVRDSRLGSPKRRRVRDYSLNDYNDSEEYKLATQAYDALEKLNDALFEAELDGKNQSEYGLPNTSPYIQEVRIKVQELCEQFDAIVGDVDQLHEEGIL